MDGLFLKFQSLSECQEALETINDRIKSDAQKNGFVVDEEGIVGVRDGKPAYDAARTETWDVPTQYDNGYVICKPDEKYLDGISSEEIEITFNSEV